MSDTTLVLPDQIEQACIELLGGIRNPAGGWLKTPRHWEHLAKLERQLDLEPETIERLSNVDLLEDEFEVSDRTMPEVRLGLEELADVPVEYRTADGRTALAMTWQLQLDVYALGKDYRDGRRRIRWLTLTVIECLLERLARRCEPVEQLKLTGCQFSVTGRGLGRAETTFAVVTADALTVLGGLPVDVAGQPGPGTPGGPPAVPYQPPVDWSDLDGIDVEFDRQPLTSQE